MLSTCFGVVAEWSKAQVLGTCLFGGVGLNPIDAVCSFVCAPLVNSKLTDANA
jgi:hypothetical protein